MATWQNKKKIQIMFWPEHLNSGIWISEAWQFELQNNFDYIVRKHILNI